MQTKRIPLQTLVECAVMIALAAVLSLVIVFRMPYDGTVTAASMAPIAIIAYRHGILYGTICGIIHGAIQMMQFNFGSIPAKTFFTYTIVILFDYIIAFGVIGLAGIFRKFGKDTKTIALWAAAGTVVALFCRLACHFISGIIVWRQFAPENMGPALYSFVYNISYMGPEMIITGVAMALIMPFVIRYVPAKRF